MHRMLESAARGTALALAVFAAAAGPAAAQSGFDPDTHARAVWIRTAGPDGGLVEIHDAFRLLDKDRRANVTHIRPEGGEWRRIGSGTYRRIEAAADPGG